MDLGQVFRGWVFQCGLFMRPLVGFAWHVCTFAVLEPNAALATQVPAYFALILRAFSVIEGIALRVDPSYSIVKVSTPGLQ